MTYQNILKSERISFLTHFIGMIFAFIGTIILIFITKEEPINLAISLIYSFSAIWLFSASSIYHATKRDENAVTVWRKLDHIAIFIMIAGTYTPLSYYYLDAPAKWIILGCQWGIALIGIFFKIFYLKAPRFLYTAIYLAMGWMVLFPIKTFLTTMSPSVLGLLFGGGAAFTLGAIFYALKRPNIKPGYFGFHEIFHILILVGAFCHYLVVLLTMCQ